MTPEEKHHIIQKALDTFGLDHQIDKMIEELGELLQATIKLRQATHSGRISTDDSITSKFFENFIEELADVDVLRDQIVYAFDMESEKSLFYEIKRQKFTRLLKRMSQSTLEDHELFSN